MKIRADKKSTAYYSDMLKYIKSKRKEKVWMLTNLSKPCVFKNPDIVLWYVVNGVRSLEKVAVSSTECIQYWIAANIW